MRYRIILMILVITISISTIYSKEYNYEFKIGKRKVDKTFNWELFYPSYYLYMILYENFELDQFYSENDLKSLIKSLIKGLSQGYQIQTNFKNYNKKGTLQITFTPNISPKNKDEYLILIISNYDFKNKKIVSGDDMKNAFANFIILENDKWVKSANVFNENKEKELKQKNKINNLCDMYLLDEINENDNLIENLLTENIKNTNDVVDKYFSTFTLNEYYLFKNNYNKCDELISEGEKLFDSIPKERQKNLKKLIKVNKDLLEIIQFVKKDEEFWKKDFKLLFEVN